MREAANGIWGRDHSADADTASTNAVAAAGSRRGSAPATKGGQHAASEPQKVLFYPLNDVYPLVRCDDESV
jgi:hypothetical protein